jgi:hypothetical protein
MLSEAKHLGWGIVFGLSRSFAALRMTVACFTEESP